MVASSSAVLGSSTSPPRMLSAIFVATPKTGARARYGPNGPSFLKLIETAVEEGLNNRRQNVVMIAVIRVIMLSAALCIGLLLSGVGCRREVCCVEASRLPRDSANWLFRDPTFDRMREMDILV